MSKYTTTVYEICKSFAGEGDSLDEIINAGRTHIFTFDYPFYDGTKKAAFERLIIRHFFMREIGFETFGLWKLMLQDWLLREMPYYNKLYLALLTDFNLLHDVDYTRTKHYTEETEADGTTTSTAESTAHNESTGTDEGSESLTSNETLKNSKTPQNGLTGLQNDRYLTEANINNRTNAGTHANETTAESDSTGSTETAGSLHNEGNKAGEETERIVGKMGGSNYSQMLMDYQKAIIDIDNIVLTAMDSELFMQVF